MKKFFTVFALFFVFICTQVFAAEGPILGKAGSRKITLEDFKRLTGYYDEDKQKALENSPQLKATLLKRYIQAEALTVQAKKEGFDRRPDIREKADMLLKDFYAAEYLRIKVAEFAAKTVIQDAEVETYYKANKEEFLLPERVKARHILVRADKAASEEEKKKAEQKIEEIHRKIKAGADFAKLAGEVSEDPGTKTKGGELDFFQKGSMVPEFEKAAFALKPGEVSGIVMTQFGYHLIKVEEKKEAGTEPLEDVAARIREKMLNNRKKQLLEATIDKAMKDSGAEINLEPLLPGK